MLETCKSCGAVFEVDESNNKEYTVVKIWGAMKSGFYLQI